MAEAAVILAPAARAERLPAQTFAAWRIHDDGHASPEEVFGSTLAEVIRSLASEATYGHTYLVLERHTISGAATLHSYRIRRGKWAGRYTEFRERKVYPHFADLLFSVKVKAFDPVMPWRWTPGCDVVGPDGRGFIEGRRV